jgi:protocatechuate 3,4-dioxygenase beta subunit
MQQVWKYLVLVAVLTALSAVAVFAQTPPSELEGTYNAIDHQIELRWHAPDVVPAPVSYNVYRSLAGEPSLALFASASDRKYDDQAVTLGQAYRYHVTAVYAGGVETAATGDVLVSAGGDSTGNGNVGSLPPRNLVAIVDDRGAVELDWTPPDSLQVPQLYRVYRSASGGPFALLGTAPEPEFDDSTVTPLTPYGYFVTALYAGDVESVSTDTVSVTTSASHDSTDDGGGDNGGGGSNAIAFSTTPSTLASIGALWTYAPVLTTNPAGQAVCFELHHFPAGMAMDPATGALSWTPANLGMFEVELRARICSGSDEAEQRFWVMVASGVPGQISGHVTDGLANPVARVRMKIFDATNGAFVLRTRTDSAGAYRFPAVNPGTYFLRADADSDRFEDMWYVNAKRLADATGIVVAESASVVADLVLQPGSEDSSGSERLAISGSVTDSSGAPVAGARVTAFRSAHHDSSGDDLFNDDHNHGGTGMEDDSFATTDSTGAYHLLVEAGSYLVQASADGFAEQFWNGKTFLLDADLLPVSGDTSGIDFRLVPGFSGQTGTGSISGTIRSTSDSLGRHAHVIGLQKNFVGQFTGFLRTARTDSAGRYTLGALPTGFYIVLAKDDDESIPAFYTPSGGTAFLDSAALLFVDGSSIAGADIYLSDDSADGLNEIEGEVEHESEHPGKTIARGTSAVTPLPGAIVVATALDGSVAGATVTDNAGAYSLQGLAAGSYTLTFQKPGSVTQYAVTCLAYVNNAPTVTTVSALLGVQPGAQAGLMGVHANWNLVSVPVSAPDLQAASLFPAATSQAFSFAGAYHGTTVLETGLGYWVKFPANQVLSVPGGELLDRTVPLVKGWNLVGSLSYPVAVASLQTTPAGILSSELFSYGAGYSVASAVEPGRGYWVKASEAGTLTMQVTAGAVTAAAAPRSRPDESIASVTFSDAAGNAQTLALGTAAASAASEMPPAPPVGAFDARFTSGRMIEAALQGSTVRQYPIAIQSAQGRLTVSWSTRASGMRFRLTDERGATLATSDQSSVMLPAGASRLTLVAEATGVPARFALDQNYPNPFNPTTSVRFEVPVASRVTLRVFNLLGQEVAVLLDGSELGEGAHSVQFDASRLASGVYLYRMEASPRGNGAQAFSEVRKMVLVK